MLVAKGHKVCSYTHYFYEKHCNDIEMDFIISNNSKLKYKMYPIEVKSGKNILQLDTRFMQSLRINLSLHLHTVLMLNIILRNGG